MGHDIEEVDVLDGTVALPVVFSHEAEDFLLLDVKTECTHGNLKLMVVDGAGLVSVKKVESFLDLLLLLFSEVSTGSAFALGSRLHLLLSGLLLAEEVGFLVHYLTLNL